MVNTVHVMPGFYCNLFCAHCGNESGPKRTTRLSRDELAKIRKEVIQYSPNKLQFTGGEPVFFAEEINEIIDAHPNISDCEVQITTNGHYATSLNNIEKYLGKIAKVDFVLLSFDKLHIGKIQEELISNLNKYCLDRDIRFCLSICITSPKDTLWAQSILSKFKVNIMFQKIDASGRAKKNNLAFNYPVFEEGMIGYTDWRPAKLDRSRRVLLSQALYSLMTFRNDIEQVYKKLANYNSFEIGLCHYSENIWWVYSHYKNIMSYNLPYERGLKKKMNFAKLIKNKMKKECRLGFLKYDFQMPEMDISSYVKNPKLKITDRAMFAGLYVPYVRVLSSRWVIEGFASDHSGGYDFYLKKGESIK